MSVKDGLRLSKRGQVRVELERNKKFYRAKQKWADAAHVHKTSLERFLRRDTVSKDVFRTICEAIDIDYNSVSLELNETRCSLQASPVLDGFYGRAQDLSNLRDWVIEDQCSLIAVTAFGGTGKSYLTKKLAVTLAEEFAGVYWVDLRNAPPVEQVFADLIKFLSNNQEITIPNDFATCWLRLLRYLEKSDWLIIFDNVESLFTGGQTGVEYRSDRAEYKKLFINLATREHYSTVIVTSREQLPGIKPLASESGKVRIYQLTGIDAEAVDILRHQKLAGNATQLQAIISRYQGNPFGINIAAGVIKRIYQGNIDLFLAQEKTVFSGVENLIETQWQKLSSREQSLMYSLALNRVPMSLEQLKNKIFIDLKSSEVDYILSSLSDRNLILITESGFTLQSLVMEHLTAKIIDQVVAEIDSANEADSTAINKLNLLHKHCLLEATAPDFIRIAQYHAIIQPVLDFMLRRIPAKVLVDKLLKIIARLRHTKSDLKHGFAPGNIINLLVGLRIDFTQADFSDLTIRQAYLQQVPLPQVNFHNCHFENTLFSQALGGILAVAFNPEQTLLATGGTDGYIRIWQVADGKEVAAWHAHEDWIRVVRFSHGGNLLASAGNDRVIKVWHWQNQQLEKRLDGHQDWVWSLNFMQQDQLLVSASTDRTAKVWSLAAGMSEPVQDYQEPEELAGAAWSIAFSPDQDTFASSTVEKVQLWSLNQQQFLDDIPEASTRVRALCFSPDGKYLAGSNDNQEIVIWEVATRKCLEKLPVASNSAIWSLKYTPDGSKLIACGTESIQTWNMVTYKPLESMLQPHHRIRSAAYSEKHHLLATGSDDQMIRIWDIEQAKSIRTIYSCNNRIWTLDVGKLDGINVIASGSDDGKVRIWHGTTGQLLHTLAGHQGRIRTVKFCPRNKRLVSAGSDRTLQLWDLTELRRKPTVVRQHTDLIWQTLFSDHGHTLISFSDDKTILQYDLRSQKTLSFPLSGNEWNWTAAINAQETILALAGDSTKIDLWDLATRTKINSLGNYQHRVKAIAFDSSGNLVSVSETGTIRILNLETQQHAAVNISSQQEVRCMVIIPPLESRAELIAIAGDDGVISIYNYQSKQYKVLGKHQGGIWSLTYSTELDYLYSCGEDEIIKFWDLKTENCQKYAAIPPLYDNMDLTETTGLSEIVQRSLQSLGAKVNSYSLAIPQNIPPIDT